MVSLGEMAAFLPHKRGFAGYATRFVDPALGFALGYNYLMKYVCGTLFQGVIALRCLDSSSLPQIISMQLVSLFNIGLRRMGPRRRFILLSGWVRRFMTLNRPEFLIRNIVIFISFSKLRRPSSSLLFKRHFSLPCQSLGCPCFRRT